MIVAIHAANLFVLLIVAVAGLLAGTLIRLLVAGAVRRRRGIEKPAETQERLTSNTSGRSLERPGETKRDPGNGSADDTSA